MAAGLLLAGCSCAEESPAPDAGDPVPGDAAPDGSTAADAGRDAAPPCDEPCPGALTCCGQGAAQRCVDTGSDPGSCGACGVACPAEAPLCRDGECVPCEAVGQTTCGGACVNLQVDDASCGACGVACGDGEQCIAGRCQGGDCELACLVIDGAGGVCCTDDDGRPACTDLRTDRDNCGACGTRCGASGRCDGGPGRCVCDEEPGRVALCDGQCRSIADDEESCGDCGVICPPEAAVCREGRCIDCGTLGLVDCGVGDCVDLETDERNCGGCGNDCGPDVECIAGACVPGDCALACNGLVDRGPLCCDDAWGLGAPGCTSLLEDPRNCGACGRDCGEAASCAAGACECPEAPDVALCDGACVSLDVDPAHCGTCDTVCPPEAPRCQDAACTSCEAVGLADCGEAACTDTSRDARHCGACGEACGPAEQCVQGACVGGECGFCAQDVGVCCSHPEARPDAGCTDLETDFWNCGGCNVWCAAGQSCQAGRCVP